MSTLKTHNLQSPDAGSVNIAMTPNAGMVVTGLSTYSNQINVGSNIKLGNAGVVTATSFVGALPISNDANNRIITATGSGGLNGEATLTYDGNTLQNLQSSNASNLTLKATSNSFNSIILDSNRSASTQFAILDGRWNGTPVTRIQYVTGTDGTNKDDGYMAFHTRESGQSLAERLRIKSNGQIVLGSDGTNSELTFTQDGTSGTQLNATTTGSGGYNTLSINSATFIHKYGSNERLRITSGGDVGISYDSPPCKLAIRDTAEFTSYAGATPNSSNILLQLWNNPPNETANDHASMQFAINGGTHNRVNTISAVAESAGNRKLAFAFCTDEAGGRTEKMRIHGDGYVTKPETPSWVLRPVYSSNQNLSSGQHAIGWSSSDYNTHAKAVRLKNVTLSGSGFSSNIHNGQTYGKITVPVAGIYRIWCTIRMENNCPNAGNIYLWIDGSQVVRQHVEMWNHQPYMHGRIEHIVNLNANSYIIWALNCNGGVVSGINDTVNWCGGHLIG